MAASLAIAAVSAGAAHDQGRKTANQQKDAIQRNDELQAMDAARQQSQLAAQGADEANSAALASQADMASLDAISGEYGGGATADRSRAVMGLQAGQNLATITGNAKASMNEAAAGAYATHSRNIGQMNSIQRPSAALAGLQVAGAAVDSYGRYKTAKDKGVK